MTMEPNASTQEQVSTTEQVSPVVVPPEVVTPPAPTPEEILNQKIAEAVSKAVALETEKARRELQSVKDKSIAEVSAAQRRAKLAESTLGATRAHIQTLDPEVGKEMELAELRAKEAGRMTMEQEEQMAQYQATVVRQFHDNMTQFITGLGVDPADQRIDWAGDAPDLLTAQRRILDSVTKVQKAKEKASTDEVDRKIADAIKRVKKDLGAEEANSVTTQMSGGISGSGIPTDRGRLGDFIDKLSTDEYVKLKPTIDKMMAEGKIK